MKNIKKKKQQAWLRFFVWVQYLSEGWVLSQG